MVININPNRINVQGGASGKTDKRRQNAPDASDFIVPKRADVNHIPSAESLQTLIGSAVEALRRGVRWDRGTILNLLT